MKPNKKLIQLAARRVAEKGYTLAFAESATGGKVVFGFSRTLYAGEILKGGVVCYDACVKEGLLGISKELIESFTPESAEVTRELAVKLKNLIKTDIAIGITGLTTPGGSEGPGKPVGTMFYCIALPSKIIERRQVFNAAPEEIIDLTTEHICKTLIHELEE